MSRSRPLVLAAAALGVVAGVGTATEPAPSCVVDVEAAISASVGPKTTDVTPLAEGVWVGDVYVMPYTYPTTYDRVLPGGFDNVQARQWVSQSFFAHNPDAYDFVAVVTGFEFDAGWGQTGDPTHALYWGVRNDTSGIGLGFFDHSQVFGSNRLQGYIDTNGLELVRDAAGTLDADHLLTILGHELGHRWLAHCDFEVSPGSQSASLRGVEDTHWSYLLDSDASYLYGADWSDNDDGSFTSTEVLARYSELDLYLMGMLQADEVEPFTLLDNPAIPAAQVPELGASITASPITVTIDQIIAAEGPRIPATDDAPRELRIALVYLVAPGAQPTSEELDFLAGIRSMWKRRFFAQTEGRGVIGVGRNGLPVVSPPSVSLDAAISWLLAHADPSGVWSDHPGTAGRDTAVAIEALDAYGGLDPVVSAALDALAIAPETTTEIDARRAESLARHQHPSGGPILDQLASWVLDEGAWGGGLRYAGDTVTTSRVVRALAAGGRTDETAPALAWIFGRQNGDGGWPWRDAGPSAAVPTLEAMGAALAVDPQSWNRAEVQDGIAWLLGRRSQGGFGDPHPDSHQTAAFLTAARGQPVGQDFVNEAVAFLAARQRTDGSWSGRVYDTAMAVAALAPFVMPDLSVSPLEVVIEPDEPFNDEPLTLTAAVRSLNGDVAAGISYRWEVIDGSQQVITTLEGLLPHIPATLFATVTDTWDLRFFVHPGTYTFRLTVDPLEELAESNEDNNVVEVPVTFRNHDGWIDLELSRDGVDLNPPVIGSLPQTVLIDGVVQNTGFTDAQDAVIAVFEAGATPALATTTVMVPQNGEAPFQLVFDVHEARPHELVVVADPDNVLNDADPSDNQIELSLGVDAVFDPAVAPGSLGVTPQAGIQAGDPVAIAFDLANRGTEPLSGVQVGVSYTTGDPQVTTPIQLLDLAEPLLPGETRTQTVDWRPPVADPDMMVAVEVDPHHLISDADRGNNAAEITIGVDPSPLPNLVANHSGISFDPSPALQGQTVEITAAVANPTDNTAGAFVARIWIDQIGTGALIAETTIPGLGPGDEVSLDGQWTVD
ncbi:MAG: CARDB domain-containing protein, partial [Candidatus Sulfomarinibacteraceae bacterium]